MRPLRRGGEGARQGGARERRGHGKGGVRKFEHISSAQASWKRLMFQLLESTTVKVQRCFRAIGFKLPAHTTTPLQRVADLQPHQGGRLLRGGGRCTTSSTLI